MAKDGREIKHECVYVGSHEDTALQPMETQPVPPSDAFAQAVALQILGGARGKYRSIGHFSKRASERSFDVFDVGYVIRNGKCIKAGEYCDEHKNYKYTFRGNIDGVDFDATFALSAEHDLVETPLLILITGCWKTKTGLRTRTF